MGSMLFLASSVMHVDEVFENGVEDIKLLKGIDDEHGGVIVEMKEAMTPEVFVTVLRASLLQWKHQVDYFIEAFFA